jgi:predicted dehydrogenase
MVNKNWSFLSLLILLLLMACQVEKNENQVRLVTLDPGHFHAALVQKSTYEDVDPVVHIYAAPGPDVQLHLDRIEGFNTRTEEPTNWQSEVYTGSDFFEKMLAEKSGNVVVISGNNEKKTEYIARSLQAGFNVLADKPMVINAEDFELLRNAFATASDTGLLLYDIMTERFEITTMLQKEFSRIPAVFGALVEGSPENPAVTKESVHHFFKYVSGSILTRPPWFMDVAKQGEGIVDVTTHLVDLIQWECFPEQILNYETDVEMISARRWPTDMTRSEFEAITKLSDFPDYLGKDVVDDSVLQVFCNGEMTYRLRGVHAKVSVIWAYRAPEGTGDTHYSIMRGTAANLVIRQGVEQEFKPTLYIEPHAMDATYEEALMGQLVNVQAKYSDVDLVKEKSGWKVIIPQKYHVGHEAHFTQVMQKFLEYLKQGNMSDWEVPNMIAKYYTTTKALELALKE